MGNVGHLLSFPRTLLCKRMKNQSRILACLLALFSTMAHADEMTPVASWDFDLVDEGPRPPEFPRFSKTNKALRFDGAGSKIVVPDEGANSRFDFSNGDAITIEAWVKPAAAKKATPLYIIGKGRTHTPGFDRENQNWSLRLTSSGGLAKLSFLFAAAPEPGDDHWGRWTSTLSFAIKPEWHHIAITYEFGKPETMRGWIDGVPTEGTWDLGGPMKDPPVVDDDAVWIGSSMGGNPGSSFDGWIDKVAIFRELATDEFMAARFQREGGPRVKGVPLTAPDPGEIDPDEVLITFHENENPAVETERWVGDSMILPRIPLRYDDWGIRTGWASPLLVRMATDIQLPPGKHEFLLRVRAQSRLWIDGKLVLKTDPITYVPPNGEEPVTPVREAPAPGIRVAGYHQQEELGEFEITSNEPIRVVLDMVVGGPNARVETGEAGVAVRLEGGEMFDVLTPRGRHGKLALTDAAIEPELEKIEARLATFDDRNRRTAAATQDVFWEKRHDIAREWVKANPAPAIPEMEGNPIDAFLQAKINLALAAGSAGNAAHAAKFYDRVLPILSENCFRCHGEKDKGDLRLNSREEALKAIVPGDADASELISRIVTDDENERMPPTDEGLHPAQVEILRDWIKGGAKWPARPVSPEDVARPNRISDAAFLRRAWLDTLGIPPSEKEAATFFADTDPGKRQKLVRRLLDDERCADHCISEWLDLLAENPTLLNHSQGSTGPFRFYLHDSLRDDKPMDRMVTELIQMRGGQHEGGSAGFSMAAENDAPFAAKGHIVASAFLGIELQCARCHDSPYHETTQRDLFSLAAMLQRKPASAPASSQVPVEFFEDKQGDALIQVTLKPGEKVAPEWPFADITGAADGPGIDRLMHNSGDHRERLAALVTTPENQRFARVIVNRLWRRLMGAGFVEPVHDWEGAKSSHPELLDWLAKEFVSHSYDFRHVAELIMTSEVYQREATGQNLAASPDRRFFLAPDRRRLKAEQIVDSLYASTGVEMDIGELTFVHDGRRQLSNRQTLGNPSRAWMLASLNNERDRPSLALPRARAVTDVLEAFGWTGSRQMPVVKRETDPNVLQPGILANGVLVQSLSRAAINSELAQVAVDAESAESLVDAIFIRILTRTPKPAERRRFVKALAAGFDQRLVPESEIVHPEPLPELPQVTWFNHGRHTANEIQIENARRVRQGPPPDPRLADEWREVFEDVVWGLFNHHEFVWMP
ncbi:DUF1553 domain-containing protein [Gimesia sp.]|uniref:DUF1553 domain-containing protein n=1 Tax=Gimesia sp. TaxID=2024833 RepID=UPI003A8C89E3